MSINIIIEKKEEKRKMESAIGPNGEPEVVATRYVLRGPGGLISFSGLPWKH